MLFVLFVANLLKKTTLLARNLRCESEEDKQESANFWDVFPQSHLITEQTEALSYLLQLHDTHDTEKTFLVHLDKKLFVFHIKMISVHNGHMTTLHSINIILRESAMNYENPKKKVHVDESDSWFNWFLIAIHSNKSKLVLTR